jgi:hypothetical protein
MSGIDVWFYDQRDADSTAEKRQSIQFESMI